MPLEVRDLGTVNEYVLSSLGVRVVLLDLHLDNVRGVLNDLGDVGAVARTDFAEDTLVDEDDAADEPVPLRKWDSRFHMRHE